MLGSGEAGTSYRQAKDQSPRIHSPGPHLDKGPFIGWNKTGPPAPAAL